MDQSMIKMQTFYIFVVLHCGTLCLGWNYTRKDGKQIQITFRNVSTSLQHASCPPDFRIMTLNDAMCVNTFHFPENYSITFWIDDRYNKCSSFHGEVDENLSSCKMGDVKNEKFSIMNSSCTKASHVICVKTYNDSMLNCEFERTTKVQLISTSKPNGSTNFTSIVGYLVPLVICCGLVLIVIVLVIVVILRRYRTKPQDKEPADKIQAHEDWNKPSASCSPYSIVGIKMPPAVSRHNLLNDTYSHANMQNDEVYDHTNFTMRHPMLKQNDPGYDTIDVMHSY